MNTYTGSCHCGAVTYEVGGDFSSGIRCNCSHCRRKGFVLAFVPESQFILRSGSERLTHYKFNKKHIDHVFCNVCGVQSFARGHDGNGIYMYAINLNCLPEFDLTTVNISDYDGAST